MSGGTAGTLNCELDLICQNLLDNDSPESNVEPVRVGRQPIFGRENQLLAYELLFRDTASDNTAIIANGDLATANVLSNTLLEIGLDGVIGDSRAFVNFTKSYLSGEIAIPLEKDRLVVEVLENVEIDDSVVAGLWRLSEQGYLIALDDFRYSPQWDPCLEIADIVKLDVLSLTSDQLAEQLAVLKNFDVTLLAEKVEDHETHQRCMDLGFEMFQGYYFAKPNIVEGQKARASQTALLNALATVNDEEAETEDIVDAVSQDASLTHKLIRYVNSSAFGRRNMVESLNQVIVYLGRQEVRSIVNLLLMTSLQDKPLLLIKTALIRAKACQNLAQAQDIGNHNAYFTAGLLSMLDALLDRPLSEVIGELPLKDELKRAIVGHEGPIGACLQIVMAQEQMATSKNDIESLFSDSFCKAYLDALRSVERGEELAAMLPRESSIFTLDKICA